MLHIFLLVPLRFSFAYFIVVLSYGVYAIRRYNSYTIVIYQSCLKYSLYINGIKLDEKLFGGYLYGVLPNGIIASAEYNTFSGIKIVVHTNDGQEVML